LDQLVINNMFKIVAHTPVGEFEIKSGEIEEDVNKEEVRDQFVDLFKDNDTVWLHNEETTFLFETGIIKNSVFEIIDLEEDE